LAFALAAAELPVAFAVAVVVVGPPFAGAEVVPFAGAPVVGACTGTGVAVRIEVCPRRSASPLPSVGFFWLMAADHSESGGAVTGVAEEDAALRAGLPLLVVGVARALR
jgi:hypothetical protein